MWKGGGLAMADKGGVFIRVGSQGHEYNGDCIPGGWGRKRHTTVESEDNRRTKATAPWTRQAENEADDDLPKRDGTKAAASTDGRMTARLNGLAREAWGGEDLLWGYERGDRFSMDEGSEGFESEMRTGRAIECCRVIDMACGLGGSEGGREGARCGAWNGAATRGGNPTIGMREQQFDFL